MTYKIKIACNGVEPLRYYWEAFDESDDQRDYYRDSIASGMESSESAADRSATLAIEQYVSYRKKIVNKTYVWKP